MEKLVRLVMRATVLLRRLRRVIVVGLSVVAILYDASRYFWPAPACVADAPAIEAIACGDGL